MAHFDIAIIGTGSGNTILDERYADKRVAICEHGVFGGTCLNVGCIPTKMFVYAAEVAQTARDTSRFGIDAHVDGVRWGDVVSRVFGRIDPLSLGGENYRRSSPNVTVFDSHTRFGPTSSEGRYTLRTDGGDEFTADQVVIAAGSRATVPAAIAESRVDYHTSDTIMRIAELPEHLVIVGGGFVAAEFAHIFSALGTRVTLVIRGATLLRQCDDTICERFTDIAAKKWEIRNHHTRHRSAPGRLGDHPDTRRWLQDAGRHGAGGHRPVPERRPARRRTGRRRGAPTAWSPSTNTSAPPPQAFSRLATSARRISSSTWPTTRPAWCATTCCRTGTTPTP